jgi:chromosome segregation ATPase
MGPITSAIYECSQFYDAKRLEIRMDDEILSAWIERDLAENDALQEFCDVDAALSTEAAPIPFIPPKFRLGGETKKARRSKKKPDVPSILQSRIAELQQMIEDRETMKDKIQKARIAFDKLRVSNAKTQRDNIEGRQFLERLRSEIDNKKLEHLRELEEQRLVERKTRIESHRSQQAQAEISQKRAAVTEELQRVTAEVSALEQSVSEFRTKRDRDKRQLEKRARELRKDNTELKAHVHEIEKRLAQLDD